MKELKWILFFLGTIATLGLLYVLFIRAKARKPFSKISPDSGNLLFIGDSLTAYENSFVDQLQKQYPNLNIKKIALGSQQTSWMLPRLRQELASGNKYNAIVIWGGINDIYATDSIDGAKSNLKQMYDVAKRSGASVIALTIVPNATHNLSTRQRTQLTNDLNSWIKANKEVDVIVDVNNLVNDGMDGTKKEFLQSDNLHLTDSAHLMIKDDFAKKVMREIIS